MLENKLVLIKVKGQEKYIYKWYDCNWIKFTKKIENARQFYSNGDFSKLPFEYELVEAK